MDKRKGVRIRDVAEAAGVSLATASNALSGRRQSETEAGRRVLAAAEALGYVARSREAVPHPLRFVVYKKSGLVVMDTPFFSELFAGLEAACSASGYTLTFSFIDCAGDPNHRARLDSLLADPSEPLLVLATEMTQADLAPFRAFDGPLVMLDSLFQTETFNTVCIDNYAAGWDGGRILIEHGHRRIGLVTSSVIFNNMLDRNRGFRSVLKDHGLALAGEDVFSVEPTLDGAFRDMSALLDARKGPLPTALFAANDIMAVGAMRALAERGVRIPGDVSVMGMDNMPFGRIMTPDLSTLDVPKREISTLAVQRLVSLAEHPDGLTLKTLVGTVPLIRGSIREADRP